MSVCSKCQTEELPAGLGQRDSPVRKNCQLNWLPKRNAGTNMRIEKTAGAVFSTVLIGRGNSELRPKFMQRLGLAGWLPSLSSLL